jgi:hypothetical protein
MYVRGIYRDLPDDAMAAVIRLAEFTRSLRDAPFSSKK